MPRARSRGAGPKPERRLEGGVAWQLAAPSDLRRPEMTLPARAQPRPLAAAAFYWSAERRRRVSSNGRCRSRGRDGVTWALGLPEAGVGGHAQVGKRGGSPSRGGRRAGAWAGRTGPRGRRESQARGLGGLGAALGRGDRAPAASDFLSRRLGAPAGWTAQGPRGPGQGLGSRRGREHREAARGAGGRAPRGPAGAGDAACCTCGGKRAEPGFVVSLGV